MAVKPVKMRGKLAEGVAEIKALMPHPMETGTRRTEAGELIPAHYPRSDLRAQWGIRAAGGVGYFGVEKPLLCVQSGGGQGRRRGCDSLARQPGRDL